MRLNRRSDRSDRARRDLELVVIAIRPVESDDEIAVTLREIRSFKTMIEHGITHPGEAGATLLHLLEEGEGLRNKRIARAGAIVAPLKLGKGQRFKRIAGSFDAVFNIVSQISLDPSHP